MSSRSHLLPAIAGRTIMTTRIVGANTWSCVRLVIIRSGSAVLSGEFGQQPVNVGDAALILTNEQNMTEPEGKATLMTMYLNPDCAVTEHRAQGSTVDTGHVIVQSPPMTRGKNANRAYVATDQWQLEDHQTRPDEEVSARSILEAVLCHAGAERSAHEMIEAEQEYWAGIGQLAAEYDTIAQTGKQGRWIRLVVIAYAHERSRPGYWRSRLDDPTFRY